MQSIVWTRKYRSFSETKHFVISFDFVSFKFVEENSRFYFDFLLLLCIFERNFLYKK